MGNYAATWQSCLLLYLTYKACTQHEEMLNALAQLGDIAVEMGDYERASTCHKTLYSVCMQFFGNSDEQTQKALLRLIEDCEKLGDTETAAQLRKKRND